MVDYPCHFSFGILDEGQLRAIKRSEEIGLRLGINMECFSKNPSALGLCNQLISLTSDRQLPSRVKRGGRRKFILTNIGI